MEPMRFQADLHIVIIHANLLLFCRSFLAGGLGRRDYWPPCALALGSKKYKLT